MGKAEKQSEMPSRNWRMWLKTPRTEGVKKDAGGLSSAITRQVGRLPGKVFSADNIMLVVYLGIAYLILSTIACP